MYFDHCKTLDDLKREFRRLAMANHPDRGGDTETMKRINAEHDEVFLRLQREHNARADADKSGSTRRSTETPEEFRRVLDLLLKLDGLTVELCGTWLWIGGETIRHKEAIKKAGCRWSNNKKLWYWRHEEAGSRWHRGKSSIQQIRAKYGSQVFDASGNEAVAV